MVKHFIFLSLLILFTAVCAPSHSYAEGKGFYPDGQVKWEYLFEDGKISEAKWYNEAGQLVTREIYTEGQVEITEGYRPDGSLEWQTKKMLDDRQEVTRFDEAGQKSALYQTLDSQPDGEYTVFYADGKPKQTVTYQMGIPEGPARTYFPSGQVEHEFFYKNGAVDGAYKTYSENGTLLTEYTFSQGSLQ